jgi:hypothetical protein
MQKRHLVLTVALTLTLASTWWAARTPDEKAGPSTATGSRAAVAAPRATPAASSAADIAQAAPPPPLTPSLYTRAPLAEKPGPEVTLAWGPPPPPPPPKMPKGYKPPPPPPPPLPFTAIGKLDDDGATTAFLLAANRTYAAKKGDTLDNNYRVEEVTSQHIVFTFLPLKARQELSLDPR